MNARGDRSGVNADRMEVTGWSGRAWTGVGTRWAVGLISIALPFALLLGGALFGVDRQSSISAYYYTPLIALLVAALAAQGVLLIGYRSMLTRIAGVAVLAVALLPTAPAPATQVQDRVGVVHLICATVYYLSLAAVSALVFARRGTRLSMLHRGAGVLVLAALGTSVVAGLFGPASRPESLLFWCETVAGLAIGVSWLVGPADVAPASGSVQSGVRVGP